MQHHSIYDHALVQDDGTASLPPIGQLARHKAWTKRLCIDLLVMIVGGQVTA